MTDDPLLEAADRALADAFPPVVHHAIETEGFTSRWPLIAELGLPFAMVAEDRGGFGASAEVAWALVRLTGAYALPLPVAETIVANHLLAEAGVKIGEGPATVAGGATLRGARSAEGVVLRGTLPRVPWGGTATIAAAAELDGAAVLVRIPSDASATVTGERNIARHPRDTIEVDVTVAAADVAPLARARERIEAAGMAMRVNQLAGATATALELTVAYTGERAQFGRTLSKFQAIQQELARMAGQVAAASAAADIAAEVADDLGRSLALHAAKARASEAAGQVASIAHQAHGAMGFAAEHRLPLFTRALWSWRDEFGTQGHCQRVVGDIVLAAGADALWSLVTAA